VNFIRDDADEHQPAGVRDIVEGVAHRFRITGRVEHHRSQRPVRDVLQFLQFRTIPAKTNGVRHVHLFLAEIEAFLVEIENDDLRAGKLDELDNRQADGTGADDEGELAGLRLTALDGMAADAQRLDEGELIERQLARRMQLAGRHQEVRP
jgi:hypothetical protein